MDFKQTYCEPEDKVQSCRHGSETSGFITTGNLTGWVTINLSRKDSALCYYNIYQYFQSQQTLI